MKRDGRQWERGRKRGKQDKGTTVAEEEEREKKTYIYLLFLLIFSLRTLSILTNPINNLLSLHHHHHHHHHQAYSSNTNSKEYVHIIRWPFLSLSPSLSLSLQVFLSPIKPNIFFPPHTSKTPELRCRREGSQYWCLLPTYAHQRPVPPSLSPFTFSLSTVPAPPASPNATLCYRLIASWFSCAYLTPRWL